MRPNTIQFTLPDLQAPAPERDPLAGAKLVAAKIKIDLRMANRAYRALEAALESGDLTRINGALLLLRTGAQSVHVLAFSLHKDVTERMRREPRVRK